MQDSNEISDIRAASRQLVRELNVLGGQCLDSSLNISECHVLTELDQRGMITVSDLAELLVLEKSTVSRVTTGLEKRGLIKVGEASGDRRKRPYILTAKGRAQVLKLHGSANTQVADALDFVPLSQREDIAAGLALYGRALRYARLCQEYAIRPIRAVDDPAMARIITEVMTEFGAVGCGYSIGDPEVVQMSAAYQDDGAAFFVVTRDDEVLGGAGVAQLKGAQEGIICELQKMYFNPRLRGTGMGTRLLIHCLDTARKLGYHSCYLETLDSMHQARRLYRKLGFEDVDRAYGETGHYKCNRWMLLKL
jgi:putative acetyltransferase